jgi:hypothetical protein
MTNNMTRASSSQALPQPHLSHEPKIPEPKSFLELLPIEIQQTILAYAFSGDVVVRRTCRARSATTGQLQPRWSYMASPRPYTVDEVYAMSQKGATLDNPRLWAEPFLDHDEDWGVEFPYPDSPDEHERLFIPLVSHWFYREAWVQARRNATFFFYNYPFFVDFAIDHARTIPSEIQRLAITIVASGWVDYQRQWVNVLDRVFTRRFQKLESFHIQFKRTGPPHTHQPGQPGLCPQGVCPLHPEQMLGYDWEGLHSIAAALRELPKLKEVHVFVKRPQTVCRSMRWPPPDIHTDLLVDQSLKRLVFGETTVEEGTCLPGCKEYTKAKSGRTKTRRSGRLQGKSCDEGPFLDKLPI